MKNKKIILSLTAAIILLFIAYAYDIPKLFKFDKKNALSEWQEKVFKNRVLYIVEPEKEGGQLLAKSKDACSGLIYKIRLNPKKYPMISWKWKVLKFPEKNLSGYKVIPSDKLTLWERLLVYLKLRPEPEVRVTASSETKSNGRDGWLEKDDYAARVYIIFPSWIFSNIKTIEYVWSNDIPKGTIMTSPYYPNIKLIVLESGKKNPDEWVFEERNIYDDYRKAFGKNPSYIGAIALMTDTDNTLSTAEAIYKDIKVGY